MPLFQKLMSSDKRYRYWMKYFQLPAARSPNELDLVGCPKYKIAEFWRYATFLLSLFLKIMTFQGMTMISMFSANYVISMQNYSSMHSPTIFWAYLWWVPESTTLTFKSLNQVQIQTIKIINFFPNYFDQTNSLFLYAIALQTMLSLYLPLVFMFLTCRLLKQRLLRITAKLKRLSGEWQFNPSKVDRYVHHFGILVDEIQRCNFFWAKYLTLNYHISIFILSISLLCGEFATWMIQ